MPLNGFNLLSCLLLMLVFSSYAQAKRNKPEYFKKTSLEFMNNLEGYKKGTNSSDIHNLKIYLHKFGYLDMNQSVSNNNDFDDALEAAIKTYQSNFHLNPTGQIDDETVAMMMMPRCGVADIINGTNFMSAKTKKGVSSIPSIGAYYSFYPGNLKWPPGQKAFTYGFMPNVPPRVVQPAKHAFARWASVTFFTFSEAEILENANLIIGWYSGDHGDGFPFDGPGMNLAHASAPTGGRLHFDADENWSVDPRPDAHHLETVATHEIGHLLGLAHSSNPYSIMWPTIGNGQTKVLNVDDIIGIRALYNM